MYGRDSTCKRAAGREGQAKACLRADEGGVGECRSSQGSQGWQARNTTQGHARARAGRDASSKGPDSRFPLAALRPPMAHVHRKWVGLADQKNPGALGPLRASRQGRPSPWIYTTLQAQLLQRQVHTTQHSTAYCDLPPCYCGVGCG